MSLKSYCPKKFEFYKLLPLQNKGHSMSEPARLKHASIEPFPSYFLYQDTYQKPQPSYWDVIKPSLQLCGGLLRNAFYLPLYQRDVHPSLERDQRLAARVMGALRREHDFCTPEVSAVRDFFSVRDIPVNISSNIYYTFKIRLFESNDLIQDKKLRLILFCFYGNGEGDSLGAQCRNWVPLTILDLENGPLSVLKALHAQKVQIDSLMTTSLGNVTLDGLRESRSQRVADELVPQVLIINRGLPSVTKVANHLYSFPFNYLLSGAAKLLEWDADPEQGMLDLLRRNSQNVNNPPRSVVMIEALNDYYFSGKGGFGPDIHKKMDESGALVFRGIFYPFPFHVRSHHSLSLDHCVYNSETKVLLNTLAFPLTEGDKMSSVIAKGVFSRGSGPLHTCFCVGGNDETLDVATVRMMPLLSAYVEQHMPKKEQVAS
jgi:hypothetical protein